MLVPSGGNCCCRQSYQPIFYSHDRPSVCISHVAYNPSSPLHRSRAWILCLADPLFHNSQQQTSLWNEGEKTMNISIFAADWVLKVRVSDWWPLSGLHKVRVRLHRSQNRHNTTNQHLSGYTLQERVATFKPTTVLSIATALESYARCSKYLARLSARNKLTLLTPDSRGR